MLISYAAAVSLERRSRIENNSAPSLLFFLPDAHRNAGVLLPSHSLILPVLRQLNGLVRRGSLPCRLRLLLRSIRGLLLRNNAGRLVIRISGGFCHVVVLICGYVASPPIPGRMPIGVK